MQLCICKYVDSIHTHCIMPFAFISETFTEICINQLIKYSGRCCLRATQQICWYYSYALYNAICNHIWAKMLIINTGGSGGCDLRAMQLCICKYVHCIHTHYIMPFAIISETFTEMVNINTKCASID